MSAGRSCGATRVVATCFVHLHMRRRNSWGKSPMKVNILLGRIVGVALCGLAAATINPVSANAGSGLQFQKVYYDSPGSDTGSNTSLNAEWVQIKNVTSTTKYLTNWTVRDNAGHVYKFPTTKVAPGDVVRLHTGKGTNSTRH